MPIGPAAGGAGFPLPSKQTHGNFMERSGWKFRQATDGLQQQALDDLHAYAFNRASPEARSPFAMSILVALYLSGAAFARATDMACSPNSAFKVLPLRKVSTAVS